MHALHDSDVIMSVMASQISSVSIFLLNRLFRRKSKKTSKLRVIDWSLWGESTGDRWISVRASKAENVPIWWRHHGMSFSSPVVICGEPGAGKTSVMAKVASLLPAWLDDGQDEDIKIILRFLGTSTSSSTTKELLKSLCSQIHQINGDKDRIESIPTVSLLVQISLEPTLNIGPESL